MKFKINSKVVKSYRVPSLGNGRQLVIPDIHGCSATLNALLEKIQLSEGDQLFFLGDYINRGPNNPSVLDTVFSLINSAIEVYPLRGNHEQMALDSYNRRLADKEQGLQPLAFRRNRPKGLVDPDGLLFPEYISFFDSLPYYYELDNYFLVHAGFDFFNANPFESYSAMLWLKDIVADPRKNGAKAIVRGHVSHTIDEIRQLVAARADIIHLDAGCYKKREEGKGVLCCLDLTNNYLYCQENIEESRLGLRQ